LVRGTSVRDGDGILFLFLEKDIVDSPPGRPNHWLMGDLKLPPS
jgi:hypothetical protein